MLTKRELTDIFLIEDLEKVYEADRKILESVEEDLELYLSEIDEHFRNDEKDNLYFNIGFLYSANCESDHDTAKLYNLLDQLKDNELIKISDRNDFLSGFDKHQNEFFGEIDFENEVERATYYVERALITKYCTDNINALKS